jgi:RHS repeat-associated protein
VGTQDRNFTGQNQDTINSGAYPLYDFLYREHHPTWGRWLSPDPGGLAAVNPSGPQTWNRYGYVTNNPTGLVDPLGLCDPANGIPCHPVYEPASNDPFAAAGWTSIAQLEIQTGWWLEYEGTINIPQLAGPEGEIPWDSTEWDVYFAYPQYGLTLPPDQAIGALQQGAARAGGIIIRIKAAPTLGQCARQAIEKSLVSLALDAAGFIPGESTAVSLIQVGVGVASTVYSLAQGDMTGSVLGGAGTGVSALVPIAKKAGWGLANALPVAGTVLNAVGTFIDLNKFNTNFQGCLAGSD